MHFGSVDYPQKLVSAQVEGTLVVFVGSGVSRNPPSSLPDFYGLASEIALAAGESKPTKQEREHLDVFLGRLANRDANVHGKAKEVLGDSDSRPNNLHECLVALFPTVDRLRIVTTNADSHLSSAAQARFDTVPEVYCAPALPPGDGFSGIVYLHGSVDGPPDRLVLTDGDFGRAYLTQGWATRFLCDMFSTCTVLFVGYSCRDTTMQYLARGLPPMSRAPRFALTPPDEVDHWSDLRITPLVYSVDDGSHAALGTSLLAWSRRASMGALRHEERIREAVQSSTLMDRETEDYINDCLSDLPRTRLFVRHADSLQWLLWVEKQGLLAPLFDPGCPQSEASRHIAEWVAAKFACEFPSAVMGVISRQRHLPKPFLSGAIVHALMQAQHSDAGLDATVLAKWVALLASFPDTLEQADLSEHLLDRCRFPGDSEAVLLLLDLATRPRLRLGRAFQSVEDTEGSPAMMDVGVEFAGTEHALVKLWADVMRDELETTHGAIEPIVRANLLLAHRLFVMFGKAGEDWDPMSLRRSAIDPSEEDRYRTAGDRLIDIARDLLEWLVDKNPVEARSVLQSWLDSRVPLLVRLAVHGVAEDPHASPDDKLRWLVRNGLVYRFEAKHEVFRLLKGAYATAEEEVRQEVLDVVVAGVKPEGLDSAEEPVREYEVYNLLYWLRQAAPECEFASAAFADICEQHPSFKPREHPDLRSWTKTTWGPMNPATIEELVERSTSSDSEWFLERLESERNEFEMEDRLANLPAAVAQDVAWSVELAEGLAPHERWSNSVWRLILAGWRGSELNEENWHRILEFLDGQPQLLSQQASAAAELLLKGVERDSYGIPERFLGKGEAVAHHIWDVESRGGPSTDQPTDPSRWLGRAINRAGGKLAEFWLRVLLRTRSGNSGDAHTIPGNYRSLFEDVLSGVSEAAELARVVLVSQLHILFELDPEWTKQQVLPVLHWEDNDRRAEQTWDGYLGWGRWVDELVPDMLRLYEATVFRAEVQMSHRLEGLCGHLAGIAVFSSVHPLENGWLMRIVKVAGPEFKKRWAGSIWQILKSMPEEAAGELWSRWLSEYWSHRTQGEPVRLTDGEKTEMTGWALELRQVFGEAVEAVCSSSAPPTEHFNYYFRRMKERGHVEASPHEASVLMGHMLSGAREPFYDCVDAAELVSLMIDHGGPANVLIGACDMLTKLGCPQGADLAKKLKARD